jgi:hypothetical protein
VTDGLAQFVRDRLDEDEQMARAAGGDVWRRQEHPSDTIAVYDSKGEPVVYDEGAPTEEQQAYIVCHDPARILDEVEAKRELLARYEAMESGVLVVVGVESILSEYRRVILPSLALPYACHPDHREEWRP